MQCSRTVIRKMFLFVMYCFTCAHSLVSLSKSDVIFNTATQHSVLREECWEMDMGPTPPHSDGSDDAGGGVDASPQTAPSSSSDQDKGVHTSMNKGRLDDKDTNAGVAQQSQSQPHHTTTASPSDVAAVNPPPPVFRMRFTGMRVGGRGASGLPTACTVIPPEEPAEKQGEFRHSLDCTGFVCISKASLSVGLSFLLDLRRYLPTLSWNGVHTMQL